jgi:anti-sigma factor (TIGR02949 family)
MADLSEMCSFVMMRINALLDNELDEETADQVRVHLSNCAECADEVEIWSTIRTAVKQAYPPGQAPQSLIARVTRELHRISAEST